MSHIRKTVSKKITRALKEFEMIQTGDRIVLGVSGGKDSITLLHDLSGRRGKFGPDFELFAVYIHSDFASPQVIPFLQEQCEALNTPLHILEVPVLARVQPGRKMNCFWCSTQRRVELMDFARQNHCNKIALGHHMDDTIETMLMNLIQYGKFEGMAPKIPYEKYPLTLIRPLVYLEEKELIAYVKHLELLQFTCQCEYGQNSERKRIRQLLQQMTEGSQTKKSNIIRALKHSAWNFTENEALK